MVCSVVGAVVIVVGLYLVIWGKSKDQNEQDLELSLNKQHIDGLKMATFKHSVDVVNSDGKPCTDLEVV